MAANDKVIRITVLVPQELYQQMHEITESLETSHNSYILRLLKRGMKLDARMLRFRDRIEGESTGDGLHQTS